MLPAQIKAVGIMAQSEEDVVRQEILSRVELVDEERACEILKLNPDSASFVLNAMQLNGQIICPSMSNPQYPLFQFDIEQGRIHPTVRDILSICPRSWSDYRLLAWLTTPQYRFNTAPMHVLDECPEEVVDAFHKAIIPPRHG